MMSDRTIKKKVLAEGKRRNLYIRLAMAALLEHEHGREFLWWLLEISKVGQQPFTANALTTSFNCGELNVGQQILTRLIEADAAGYVRLIEEKHNAPRREREHTADTDSDPDSDAASSRSDSGGASGDSDAGGRTDPFASRLEDI